MLRIEFTLGTKTGEILGTIAIDNGFHGGQTAIVRVFGQGCLTHVTNRTAQVTKRGRSVAVSPPKLPSLPKKGKGSLATVRWFVLNTPRDRASSFLTPTISALFALRAFIVFFNPSASNRYSPECKFLRKNAMSNSCALVKLEKPSS